MDKSSSSRAALTDAVWFRWLLIVLGIIIWLGIMREFPLYFQRDDVQWMHWANHRSILDSFVPKPGYGFSIDKAFRPLMSCYWWVLYRTFGLHFNVFYALTGLLFISTLALLFKLVTTLSDSRSAYLSLLVWLVAFQFLMTVLFWITDHVYLLMTIMVMSGLILLVTGLGVSRLKVAAGLFLMLAAILVWESLALIGWTTVAVLIAIRAKSLGWSFRKAAVFSASAFAVGPAYWLVFPFARQRVESSGAPLLPSAADMATRFSYYAGYLFSGVTGIILLFPAVYCITSYLLGHAGRRSEARVPVSLITAVVVSVAIVKLQALALGLAVVLVAGLLLPRPTYMFLPMVCVPIAGLLVFAEPSRTYLFLPSYALAALTGIEMGRLWSDVHNWWTARVRCQVIIFALVVLAIALVVAPVTKKLRSQLQVLRLRSDVTQSTKLMTPHLKRLPRGAFVVVVDYAAMGFRFGEAMLRWTDREKLLYQAPVDSTKAQFWFDDIGRNDLQVVTFSDYVKQPGAYLRRSPVYVWLQTAKDHEFFARQRLQVITTAKVRYGQARATLLRLK